MTADKLKILCNLAAFLRTVKEIALGIGDGGSCKGELTARCHSDLRQLANSLTRRGNHAAHLINLIAKKLYAHR